MKYGVLGGASSMMIPYWASGEEWSGRRQRTRPDWSYGAMLFRSGPEHLVQQDGGASRTMRIVTAGPI